MNAIRFASLLILLALIACSGFSFHSVWQFAAKQANGYAATEGFAWVAVLLHLAVAAAVVCAHTGDYFKRDKDS